MEKKVALANLVYLTNRNFGYTPSTPTEFNDLSRAVQKVTGRAISLSSIKRIWGYVKYEGFPSITTLNILSHYNGFLDWATFVKSGCTIMQTDDSSFTEDTLFSTDILNPGDTLSLVWNDDKTCVMECLSYKRFRVVSSQNIKLMPGDTLTIHTLSVGLPIYASDLIRGDVRLPAYVGAKVGGLTKIDITRR